MTEVRIEQFSEYPDGPECAGGIRLSEWRVFPMPVPERAISLWVGEGVVDLTREGAIEIANALREAALDG